MTEYRLDELNSSPRPRREYRLDELTGSITASKQMARGWAEQDITEGAVTPVTYMERAADRIQQYQEARSQAGQKRLSANEQVAIVDTFREIAGLQPEGFVRTSTGAVALDPVALQNAKRYEEVQGSSWENFKANIAETTLSNLAGIRASQARITDALGWTDGAVAEAEVATTEINRIFQPQEGVSGFAGDAVGNLMNLFIGRVGGFGSAPTAFAAATAGSTFIDVARRRTAGEDISPVDEWTAALANAGVEYALETFGQHVANKAGIRLSGSVNALKNTIAKGGLRTGIRSVAGIVAKGAVQQAGLAGQGAAEEGVTQILQNTINRLTFAKDQGILDGAGIAALHGLVMAPMASGPFALIQGKKKGKTPDVPPASSVADQTLQDNSPLAKQAQVEQALKSEGFLPDELKASYPSEQDLPDAAQGLDYSRNALVDKWIGDRHLADWKADTDSGRKQNYLNEITRDGEKSSDVDAALAVYIDMQANPDAYTVENIEQLTEAQQSLVEQAMSLSVDQRTLADQIIKENNAMGLEGLDAGVLRNVHDNYSTRIWKSTKSSGKARGKFTLSTPRARKRTLPSLIEGWSRGLELEVPGVIEAQRIARKQVAQAIHDRNYISLAKKSGVLSSKYDAKTHPTRVEHPRFQTWEWAGKVEAEEQDAILKMENYGQNSFIDPDGNLMERRDLYTNKNAGRFLNNVLGTSDLFNVPGVGEVLKFNQVLKHVILTTSGFHYMAFLRSYMLGSRGLNPVKAYREGRELIQSQNPMIQELVHAGMTLGKVQDFNLAIQREGTKIGEAIGKVPMLGDVRRALQSLSRANTSFLFNKMGPFLKAQAAMLELQHQLKKNDRAIMDGRVDRRTIVQEVASLVNDDFGGLNLERMGRNPTVQAVHRILSLAPDWTESNVRSMVKAFKGGEAGKVYRGLWGRVLLKGLGATILSNFLMSAFDDDDFVTRYKKAWESGNLKWTDVDITPIYRGLGGEKGKRKYFSILGHFTDPVKFVTQPVRSAKGKSSVAGRILLESMVGTDWKGREFTSYTDLISNGETVKWQAFGGGPIAPSQFPSFVLHQAQQSTPVQVQSLIQWLKGEMDGFDAITRGVGVPTKTSYPPKTGGKKRAKVKKRAKK